MPKNLAGAVAFLVLWINASPAIGRAAVKSDSENHIRIAAPATNAPSESKSEVSRPSAQKTLSRAGLTSAPLNDPQPIEKSQTQSDPPPDDLDGPESILERVRWYLQRHGDQGRIDPERRLQQIRAEYEKRETEKRTSSPAAVNGVNWISLGPTNGAGRMTAIAPHPTATGTLYMGAAGGGVWKTTDSGATWTPLTDSLNDLSVGAVAVAPSSPNIIYLGTGEGGYAIDFIPGTGFLKSTDGGNTWQLPSAIVAAMFYRISVHPTNPLELVVGTGLGAFQSMDGGSSWINVISKQIFGDVTDIVRNPADPKVLYAATWDAFLWCARSGGCAVKSSRIMKSVDGGISWVEKSNGFPISTSTQYVSRISLAMSPSNPWVLYAATAIRNTTTNDEVSHIFKTTDGGETWTDLPGISANADSGIRHFFGSQVWYDNTIVVSPNNPDIVIAGGVTYVRSKDGGQTWSRPPLTGSSVHVDVHDLHYQGSVLYIANDGGIWVSPDDGDTAVERNAGLVTRQYYGLCMDPANRNRIFAGSQDNGTVRRPDSGGTAWSAVIGGDGFECGVNPMVPDFAYGTVQFGALFRAKSAQNVPTPFTRITPPYPSGELLPFLSVFIVDPNRPSTIYTASNRVWKSTDGGDTWTPLSTTTTDGSIWTATPISGLAVAQGHSNILMTAKDSLIFRTTNGGASWVRTTNGLPIGHVNNLEIDPRNPNVAYAAYGGTGRPRVVKTTNGGESWSALDSGLPLFPAQVVRVDPTDSNVIFVGMDVGVYRSTDGGATWFPFGVGLPNSSVHDVRISEDGSMLRVATHGRGIWELQIPPTGNNPPQVNITSPTTPPMLTTGANQSFSGSISDPDAADLVSGVWTFTDTWEAVSALAGVSTVSHTFVKAGLHRAALTAMDSHGAAASTSTLVAVHETFESCTTPLSIPGDGPFPVAFNVSNEVAPSSPTDPKPACASFTGHPLWFEFTPTRTAPYEFSTCGTLVDTVLSLWTGNACGPYTAISGACNEDAPSGSPCFGTTASYLKVNLTAGQTVRILANSFSTSSGGPFQLTVRRDRSPLDVLLPGNDGFVTQSLGGSALSVTYGQVTSSTLTSPAIFANYGLTQNGALVTEVGVPAASPLMRTRMFVDLTNGADSGVALVNPGDTPLTIFLDAKDEAGAKRSSAPSVQTSTLTLPAKGHKSLFVSQMELNLPNSFRGTLTLSSSRPFVALNLRSTTNCHGETLLTALPLADLDNPSGSESLIFTQIVDGGGLPTQILLMNPSSALVASGTVNLFDDAGHPIELDFGPPLGVRSSFPYSIAPDGRVKFETTGVGLLRVGYAVVTRLSGSMPIGSAIFSSQSASGPASQAGVPNSPLITAARAFVETTASPLNRNTGIAVVNRNPVAADLNLQLVGFDGSVRNFSRPMNPNEHWAQFITELFTGLPANFQGTLTLTSSQPLAVLTLRWTKNQRNEDIFSTLPVANLNNPPPIPQFLAQVVDGGGFLTQLILLATSSASGTVHIEFLDDNGAPVGLLLP